MLCGQAASVLVGCSKVTDVMTLLTDVMTLGGQRADPQGVRKREDGREKGVAHQLPQRPHDPRERCAARHHLWQVLSRPARLGAVQGVGVRE